MNIYLFRWKDLFFRSLLINLLNCMTFLLKKTSKQEIICIIEACQSFDLPLLVGGAYADRCQLDTGTLWPIGQRSWGKKNWRWNRGVWVIDHQSIMEVCRGHPPPAALSQYQNNSTTPFFYPTQTLLYLIFISESTLGSRIRTWVSSSSTARTEMTKIVVFLGPKWNCPMTLIIFIC